jgi:hypothetical protein
VAGITNSYCPTWDSSRLNGTVTLTGFAPGTYSVEWWNFDNNVALTKTTSSVTVVSDNKLILPLTSLPATVTDTGVKIGDYTATGHKTNITDYRSAISSLLNIFNLNTIISNYGK